MLKFEIFSSATSCSATMLTVEIFNTITSSINSRIAKQPTSETKGNSSSLPITRQAISNTNNSNKDYSINS